MKGEHVLSIRTARLNIIQTTPDILEKILEGDDALGRYLDIRIPHPWSEFGHAPFLYIQKQLQQVPGSESWWSWLPVLTEDNTLAGNCGFKGAPKEGVVEIGYEVAPVYRRRGLATEIAQALITHTFTHEEVSSVIAHTLPEENHSVRVLKKCGFHFDGIVQDPEDGTVWRWTCPRTSI